VSPGGDPSLRSGRHKEGARDEEKERENEIRGASACARRDKEGSLGRTDAVERDCHPKHRKEYRLALLRFAKMTKGKVEKGKGTAPFTLKIN